MRDIFLGIFMFLMALFFMADDQKFPAIIFAFASTFFLILGAVEVIP